MSESSYDSYSSSSESEDGADDAVARTSSSDVLASAAAPPPAAPAAVATVHDVPPSLVDDQVTPPNEAATVVKTPRSSATKESTIEVHHHSSHHGSAARAAAPILHAKISEEDLAFSDNAPFFMVVQSRQTRLGGGSFGAVFKATLRGEQVAAKTFHALLNPINYGIDTTEQLEPIVREATRELDALKSLHHPNIVAFKGIAMGDCLGVEVPKWICMELCRTTLQQRIYGSAGRQRGAPAAATDDVAGLMHPQHKRSRHAPPPPLRLGEISRMVWEMASGLNYLHSMDFVHRDMKPANVMIAFDGTVKLADLGLARVVSHLGTVTSGALTLCGTPIYMAPEVKPGHDYDWHVDIYALGVIMAEMVLKEPPPAQHGARVLYAKRAAHHTSQLKPLVIGCTQKRASRRPMASQICTTLEKAYPELAEPREEAKVPPPRDFVCPITIDLMQDPVICSDGMTFERDAIMQWFAGGHKTSPITNLELEHTNLVPNRALRSAIEEWTGANESREKAAADALAAAEAEKNAEELAKKNAEELAKHLAEEKVRAKAAAKEAARLEAEAKALAEATAAAVRHNTIAALQTDIATHADALIMSGRQKGRRANCMGVFRRLGHDRDRFGAPIFEMKSARAEDPTHYLFRGGDSSWYVGRRLDVKLGHTGQLRSQRHGTLFSHWVYRNLSVGSPIRNKSAGDYSNDSNLRLDLELELEVVRDVSEETWDADTTPSAMVAHENVWITAAVPTKKESSVVLGVAAGSKIETLCLATYHDKSCEVRVQECGAGGLAGRTIIPWGHYGLYFGDGCEYHSPARYAPAIIKVDTDACAFVVTVRHTWVGSTQCGISLFNVAGRYSGQHFTLEEEE